MSAWPILASLWRPLRRGRSSPPRSFSSASPLEPGWVELLRHLDLPAGALQDMIATGSLQPHFHYRRYTRPKKGGGQRQIAEPSPLLKRTQQAIISTFFTAEQAHPAAVAYQRGKSTADHAWTHAGAAIIVTADIRDFFPSTAVHRIADWWRERVDESTARLLTRLTTDRGGLPQGAPTSPGLSNLVNRELDARLARRAEAAGARYSRYCDDLAFSWFDQSEPAAEFERDVRATLHEFGYTLHPEKGWCVHGRRDEPEITGVILTRHGGVRLPERVRQVMQSLGRSATGRDVQRLAGYRAYAAMVTHQPGSRRKRKKKPRPARPARPAVVGSHPVPTLGNQGLRKPDVVARGPEEEIPF